MVCSMIAVVAVFSIQIDCSSFSSLDECQLETERWALRMDLYLRRQGLRQRASAACFVPTYPYRVGSRPLERRSDSYSEAIVDGHPYTH
jgi:hypothetical protein